LFWLWTALEMTPDVRLSLERAEVPDNYASMQLAAGLSGPAALAACRSLTDGVQLCLRTMEVTTIEPDSSIATKKGAKPKRVVSWRLANEADLSTWGESQTEAEQRAIRLAQARWVANPPKLIEVEGVGHSYLLIQGEQGEDALGLLEPQRLLSLPGAGPLAVGVPTRGTLVAWRAGDAVMDKILGVGVRRIYDEASPGLSPSIFQEGVQGWQVWAVIQGDVNPNQTPNVQVGQEVGP